MRNFAKFLQDTENKAETPQNEKTTKEQKNHKKAKTRQVFE